MREFKNHPIKRLMWLCICLLTSLILVGSVTAAGETIVSVEPVESTVLLNNSNQTNVSIAVGGVIDINAFDIIVTYNESIGVVTDWSHGGFLTNLICLISTNDPGYFRLVCTQKSSPGVSGDGILLNLTFDGISPGGTRIRIGKAELSDKDNHLILPAIENGWLTAAYDPALLEQFPLTGEVSLQGQSQRAGVLIALGLGTAYQIGPYGTASLDQDGSNFDFGSVVGDAYIITTSQPRYLNLTASQAKTITVSADKSAINPLWMLAGNAVWTDDVVDTADASLVGASYGRTVNDLAPGETLDADVNFDGVVNLRDLALVAGNYGLTSAVAYGGWQP